MIDAAVVGYLANGGIERKVHPAAKRLRPVAFFHEHFDNLARGSVTEQLTKRFFMKGDTIAAHQFDKILRRVPSQRRLGKMRVGGQIAFLRMDRCRVDVGEIAAATTRNQDFLTRSRCMVNHQHAPSALPCGQRTHQSSAASAQNYYIIVVRNCHFEAPALPAPYCQVLCFAAKPRA